ncbi:MAG: DUF3369 domain-containing protein [Magnetococcus sp. WYHC-3]
MNNTLDDLGLAPEPSASPPQEAGTTPPWKVMVIDDDEDVHVLTRIVLKDVRFAGRGVAFVHGYSGAEACRLMREHPDTAVLLLDVVMESDHAGLEVVRRVREELNNRSVRIILRTGQPGQAPESSVIADYDINDYKAKSDLSSRKLVTALVASLRNFRDIRNIEQSRAGLARIIETTDQLFEVSSLQRLASGILMQLSGLLGWEESSLLALPGRGLAAVDDPASGWRGLAGTGQFEACNGRPLTDLGLTLREKACVDEVLLRGGTSFDEDTYAGMFRASSGQRTLILYRGQRPLGLLDQDLIRIFSTNIALAFENLALHQEVLSTQEEITFMLGEVIEMRCKETGHHVRRVAESSQLLGRLLGLDEHDAEMLRRAAPLHDLGKIAIPDRILRKPAALDAEEWDQVRAHAEYGYRILQRTQRAVLGMAATIARDHHERWDGQGYPNGLRGEQIPLVARIVTLIDVFDSLLHPRVYKPAWPLEQVVELIRRERGAAFDPRVVDAFLAHLPHFLEIQRPPQEDMAM